jgi:hypothetical protein
VPEPVSISLTYTPTLDEWERTAEAWARATGATRRRLVWGWIAIAVAGVALGLVLAGLTDDVLDVGSLVLAVVFTAYGITLLTDVAGRWLRRRQMSRVPHALLPSSAIAREDDLFLGTAISSSTVAWDFWRSLLVLEDRLVLATDVRSTANWVYLPRRGLHDPDQWTALVRLVSAHVPTHPRSPLPEQRAV